MPQSKPSPDSPWAKMDAWLENTMNDPSPTRGMVKLMGGIVLSAVAIILFVIAAVSGVALVVGLLIKVFSFFL